MKKLLCFFGVLTLFADSHGMMLRSEEHIANRPKVLKYIDKFAAEFAIEYTNYTRTGLRTAKLDNMFTVGKLPNIVIKEEYTELPPEAAIVSCLVCRSTLALILSRYRSGERNQQETMDDAVDLCMQFTDFGIAVCQGVVDLNAEIFFHIIDARPELNANAMCSVVHPTECGDPDVMFNFAINVSPGPPITAPKTGSTPRRPDELRILHISDPHYDPAYLVGGYANCPEPTCCRRDRGIAANPADRAGRWGDYRDCDSPWEVVEDMLRSARRDHPQIDIVYITGDYVDHGVWETTHAGNIAIMDRFYNMVAQVFQGVPVYPVLGNHEAQPTNVFAPPHITQPSMSVQWLYDYSANAWARWLPPSAQATIRRQGHYTVLHSPGFRIIAMNNNNCYIYDWWLMYARVETAFQLQWLHDTLLMAEQNGELVHILYHINSGGGSCIRWWSIQFRRVIDRFHRIIQGQFTGHSHRDEFSVFYDSATHTIPINYAWNGGTTTTYRNVNPNYVLYYVDRERYQVNEKESWMYHITEANLNPATFPRWFRHYSFREHFGIADMSPFGLDHFIVNTLARNRQALQDYREFRVSAGTPFMEAPCDDACLRNSLCQTVINEFNDLRRCNFVSQFPLQ